MDLRIDTNTSLISDSNGEATWTFTTVFEDNPIVTAIIVGDNADSNIIISALSKAAVTLQTSFAGGDKIHATAISSTASRRPPMILP